MTTSSPNRSVRLLATAIFTLTAGAACYGMAPANVPAFAPAPIVVPVPAPAAEPIRASVVPAAPADPRATAAALAIDALAPAVSRLSSDDALRTAVQAYYNYRAANPYEVRKPYFYFVDLGLDNATPRGYVFDMDAMRIVEGPFTVAHGRGSSSMRNGVPTMFSNRSGSNASSLGLYLAQETYTFRGKSAGRSYTSVGLRMKGESGSFNSAARSRGIVAHGAPYVTAREAGRSEGCPAMEQARADRLLPMIANGGVVFIYSPHDSRWVDSDRWVHASE